MSIRRFVLTLTLAPLWCACGTPNPSNVDASLHPDAGSPDAAADAPVDAAADAAPAVDSAQVLPGWADGPAIPIARDHHQTFVIESGSARYLYVAGGYGGSALEDVSRATIADDGTLGAWAAVTPRLPFPIVGGGVGVTHGEVILAGGLSSARTYTSLIQADGSLGAWTPGPALAGERFHTSLAIYGDFAYLLGGLQGTMTVDDVARASIAADGTLGAWSVVAHLPRTMSHHATAVQGNTLYVIGGETGNPNDNTAIAYPDVYTATLATDGSVGPFVATSPLPIALVTHSAFVYQGALYALGGLTVSADQQTTAVSAAMFHAPIQSDGSLGAWVTDASMLPIPRSHVHQTPMWQNHVYSVAGADENLAAINNVFVGSF